MSLAILTKTHVRTLLPARAVDGHKGTFGHLFIVAGSRGFTGAAKLSGLAAARSGVGLVTVGAPRMLCDVIATGTMELMTFPLRSTRDDSVSRDAAADALTFAKDKDAVAVGPGLSHRKSTQDFVRTMVLRCAAPMVIDADGLNAIVGHTKLLKKTRQLALITPHPGEMARLCGRDAKEVQSDRAGIATAFAQENRCVVVLKGHHTVIASPDGDVFVNRTGNSGMGTGGTGDVLTGILGGLIAQGVGPVAAAQLGVYLHGLAGDIAAAELTERGMIAGDVIQRLPNAWRLIEGALDA